MKTIAFLITALIANAAAFAPSTQFRATTSLQSTKDSYDPLNLSVEDNGRKMDSIPKIAAASAAAFALSPLAAVAEEVVDDYEYGAVSAPIGLAWGAGVLAVLTALLPIALQGGEEAFEEMRQSDEKTWGSGNSNRLSGRK